MASSSMNKLKWRASIDFPIELGLKIEAAAGARNQSTAAFVRDVLTRYFQVIPLPKPEPPKPNSLALEWQLMQESTKGTTLQTQTQTPEQTQTEDPSPS